MPQTIEYLYDDPLPGALSKWIPATSTYQFPPITLYDKTGAVIPMVTDIFLTLIDLAGGTSAIVNGVNHLSIKATNPRGHPVGGVLTLILAPTLATIGDTAMLVTTRDHEMRRALIQYTYGSGGGNNDIITLDFVVKRVPRHPFVP